MQGRIPWLSSLPVIASAGNWLAVMRAIFAMLGSLMLGWLGWVLGAHIGFGTALVLSCIGSGFGLYWGRRLFDEWLG